MAARRQVTCLCSSDTSQFLHKECFAAWERTNVGKQLTCPYCRQNVHTVPAGGSTAPTMQDGYTNYGSAFGLGRRDTSSYYNGPRAGERLRDSEYNAHIRYGGTHDEYYAANPHRRSGYGRYDYDF